VRAADAVVVAAAVAAHEAREAFAALALTSGPPMRPIAILT